MFTRILATTDFSEPSDSALEYARKLAERFGASLHVLHVIEMPSAMGVEGCAANFSAFEARMVDDARNRLRQEVATDDRTPYATATAVVVGTSARSILSYATEKRIDLIVMGTHGRSGLSHLLMGSVAEQVVRQAPCPVMTVRRPTGSQLRVREHRQKECVETAG